VATALYKTVYGFSTVSFELLYIQLSWVGKTAPIRNGSQHKIYDVIVYVWASAFSELLFWAEQKE